MIHLPGDHPLTQVVKELVGLDALLAELPDGLLLTRLRASRLVFRLASLDGRVAVVGKFFGAYPPLTSQDLALVQEYNNYQQAPAWGLTQSGPVIPLALGQCPHLRLGLLLTDIPGPDLDFFLTRAITAKEFPELCRRLEMLAGLLAFFHSRPGLGEQVAAGAALTYFLKIHGQLHQMGLLTEGEAARLRQEAQEWEKLLTYYPDQKVLVHGDATPTNFLFPDHRVVAVDLERLRWADRLWDVSWVAGELKHAWGWRRGDFAAAEAAISFFLQSYLEAVGAEEKLARRLYGLNPFYMAMTELRIARNAYLSWEYRQELIAEAFRCLRGGRQQNLYC